MDAARDVIRLESVGRCFRTASRSEVWALRNLNLTCAEGELACVLGPSGCGKTTLLRLLAGLDRPTAGRVCVNGGEVTCPPKDIGFVSQEGDLLPWRRTLANVALGLEIRRMRPAERRQRAIAALARVHLPPDVAESYAHELSGGMRQRVALARALCVSPRILLMDEPFGRLDEPTRHQLQDDLADVWLSDRQTILFVTHSVEEAVFLADRVIVMDFGSVAAELRVTLPRPRDRFSVAFLDAMREVRSQLREAGGTR
jgi:NitT/TauT family transport system ATP-binding protein